MLITKNSNIIIFILFILTAIAFAISARYFSKKQKIIRTLSNLPIQEIGKFKNNTLTHYSGKAFEIHEPLIAPFSEKKCVFYQLKIEQLDKSLKNSKWKTVKKEEKAQDFLLEDNGNFAFIKPKDYISYVVTNKKVVFDALNKATPKLQNLLKRYEIENINWNSRKPLRFSESIIEVGQQLSVAGIANWTSLDFPIKHYSYSKIIKLSSTKSQKLIISNLPNNKK